VANLDDLYFIIEKRINLLIYRFKKYRLHHYHRVVFILE